MSPSNRDPVQKIRVCACKLAFQIKSENVSGNIQL